MEEKLRIMKLEEIQKNEVASMTGITIKYKGESIKLDAYRIPLEYLIYNKYNGRIGTSIKSFESEKYLLNAEDIKHKKLIEEFLWNSKIDRNKYTMESLVKDKQENYGIVSRNGVIIDGNRRASLLNRIVNERSIWGKKGDISHCKYFLAVILPDDAGKKEIMELETRYQMGQDEKLDYNPEEKYLKCFELSDAGFSIVEIADMMADSESTIKEYLSIFDLMNEYLEQFEYDGMYTRLEKREGQLKDLNNYMEKWYERKSKADWNYNDDDLELLKTISFDYIRAQYEGKEFRVIAKTNRQKLDSLFSYGKVWKKFSDEHMNIIDNITEKDIDELKNENKDEDLSKILSARDKDWTKQATKKIKHNLKSSNYDLDTKQQADEPPKLIERAKKALEEIDVNLETFWNDSVVEEKVNELNKLTYELKKVIKEKRRKIKV